MSTMLSKKLLAYLPLTSICLFSVIFGVYGCSLYVKSYIALHDFKVYVDGVQIIKNGVYAININFTIYNPSDQNLRLKYLRPLVELNGRSIELEDPPFLKPQPGTVFNLLANKNTTLVFSKNLKSWNLNAENGLWFFIVYITVEGLPLVEMATLQRVVKYKW